jgi:agmatinase
MRPVSDLIRDPDLWGGLNRPDIAREEADVVVCGIPYEGGISIPCRSGTAEAPRAVRDLTCSICPTTEDFEVMNLKLLDLGDADASDRDALFAYVEALATELVRTGKFFTFIGGDHSVSIPIMRGIDRAIGHEFGILYLDAHFDLCDELNGDRLSHGCTARRAVELAHISSAENIFFVGVRSSETCESEFVRYNPVNVIGARELRKIGVDEALNQIRDQMGRFQSLYLTIDIDALDPAFAPGTGTPQSGGLDARELLDLLRGLMKLPIVGFDLVEISPPLDDPSGITLYAARKILMECWGHHWRKNTWS